MATPSVLGSDLTVLTLRTLCILALCSGLLASVFLSCSVKARRKVQDGLVSLGVASQGSTKSCPRPNLQPRCGRQSPKRPLHGHVWAKSRLEAPITCSSNLREFISLIPNTSSQWVWAWLICCGAISKQARPPQNHHQRNHPSR